MGTTNQPPKGNGTTPLKFDESKTYLIKGSTLRRLCKAVNEWTNLEVKWGPASGTPSITRAETKSILLIPQWSGASGSITKHPWRVVAGEVSGEYEVVQPLLFLDAIALTPYEVVNPGGYSLSPNTHIWLSGSFNSSGTPTGWSITTEDPAELTELITWSGGGSDPYVQATAFYPLARVIEDHHPEMSGFDFNIGAAKYHLEQLCSFKLLIARGIVNGRLVYYPTAF